MMTYRLRRASIASICFALALAATTPASANSWGNDRSDAWWNPNESGWGVMMSQQQDSIFVAMFLYGADGKATWFTGLLDYNGSNYEGQLSASTGPSHLGSFNPNAVSRRTVGTARLVPAGDNRFTLTYTVDGATVTKSIERLTWESNTLGGGYYGGFVGTTSNCYQSFLNGYFTLLSQMNITHNGSTLLVSGTFLNNKGGSTTCSFAATYQQYGRIGEASGNYTCGATGEAGTFSLDRIEVTENGMLARASASSNVCNFSGRFGAIKN
ncbi:MAG: hypothetical protein ACR2HE_03245 [Casimicrobiaceae bacterium]